MAGKPLAFYLAARSLLYFRHVLKRIPPDMADILVPAGMLEDGAPPCPALEELRHAGHHVLAAESAGGGYGALVVAGYPDLERNPCLWPLAPRRILMMHATTFLPELLFGGHTHHVCMHEIQARLAAGPDAVPPAPDLAGQEFCQAGMYQLGEWETLRHADRAKLRDSLQASLRVPLPRDRKLILHCGGRTDEPEAQNRIVHALARRHVVIFKPYYFLPQHERLAGMPFVHVIRDTISVSPDAMRFAADVILAHPASGVFTTCLLLGLRVLPVLTDRQAAASGSTDLVPWQERDWGSDRPAMEAARLLGGPYDASHLGMLADVIEDEDFWQEYDAAGPEFRRRFFGACRIEGAAEHAAKLLLRVAIRGTFGEDTLLVRPRG